jgi:hypothetical protein
MVSGGGGLMSRKTKRPLDIFSLSAQLNELNEALRKAAMIRGGLIAGDLAHQVEHVKRLAQLEGYDALLSHQRYDGHAMHLKYVRSSIERERYHIAVDHLGRLAKIVRPTTNDRPFQKGDPVWINRTEHGWNVGSGVVTKVTGAPPDIVTYEVMLDDGDYPVFVNHTRDLSPN